MLKRIIKKFLEKKQFVIGDINLNSRKGALHKSWGHIFSNHLHGDYVEFGIYHGDSFVDSIKVFLEFKLWLKNQLKSPEDWRIKVSENSSLNKEIFFHGLDTFEGMPKNEEKNFIYKEGNFEASESAVSSRLKKFLKENIKTFLYKGEFKNTAENLKKNLKNRKVSIANFDCDLKKSTSEALETIESFIQIGTIFLFDDYNGFNANEKMGQRVAFVDFKKTTKFKFEKFFTYHYSGQAFLCIGKDS